MKINVVKFYLSSEMLGRIFKKSLLAEDFSLPSK